MQGKTVSAELIRKAAMLLASGRNFTFAAVSDRHNLQNSA